VVPRALTATSRCMATSPYWMPNLRLVQTAAIRRRTLQITRSKLAASIATRILLRSRFLVRSLTMSLVTMAIPSKALFPHIMFGISRLNLDSGKGELESSRVSGTSSTKVIGARSARKASCPRCHGTTTAVSKSSSRAWFHRSCSGCLRLPMNRASKLTALIERR